MNDKILTYSRSRGLFAGIDLSGTVVKQDKDETALLFGNMEPSDAILTGKVPPPAASQPLLNELQKITDEARNRERASNVTPNSQ
jgi:lipid-binding SYLF domain-containing protein